MSVDTGAREPQDSVSALLQKAQEMRERAEDWVVWLGDQQGLGGVMLTEEDAARLKRDIAAALAAGVGVPPQADKSLGSAAENAARVDVIRDALGHYVKAASEPFRWSLTVVDARRGVAAQAALEALASEVGEARPAEPPARAALGDVAAAESSQGSALRQRAPETREGGSADG